VTCRHATRATCTSPTSTSTRRSTTLTPVPPPLVWTFDGPFERCLDDLEDSLRRAIVLIGDVSRVALLIDLSLPALQRRVQAGDRIQPAWGRFVERLSGYGLPSFPRVRHLRTRGPLATLVVAYRS